MANSKEIIVVNNTSITYEISRILTRETNNTIQFMTTVNGRDKFYRLAQYLLRFISFLIQLKWINNPLSDPMGKIAGGFGAGRRFVRLGGLPGTIKSVLESFSEADIIVRYCNFLARLSGLIFMILDHANWVSRCGVFKMDYDQMSIYDSMCWLGSLAPAILGDTYTYVKSTIKEIELLKKRDYLLTQSTSAPTEMKTVEEQIKSLKIKKVTCILNIIRNGSDMPIALSGIFRWKNVPNGLFPFLGSISSVLACYQTWPVTPPKVTTITEPTKPAEKTISSTKP